MNDVFICALQKGALSVSLTDLLEELKAPRGSKASLLSHDGAAALMSHLLDAPVVVLSTGSISKFPKTGGACLTGVVCNVGNDLVPGPSGFYTPDTKVVARR